MSQEHFLNDIDRKIIYATQTGLPLVSRPYHHIAQRLDISVDELIARMDLMKQHGIIRRIAAVPNHYALGYNANAMTVWDIVDERVDELGRKLGALDFVSHCYHRPRYIPDWPYNLFAMVHATSRDKALLLVDKIKNLLADEVRSHDVLFSQRILKKTGLRIKSIEGRSNDVPN